MIKKNRLLIYFLVFAHQAWCQPSTFNKTLDSLLSLKMEVPFNGLILISIGENIAYNKIVGFSDMKKKTPLCEEAQFIIGSISKQFTAVLILREFEAGHLTLNTPIKTYLPKIKQAWADTVTVHHLLTHTHGIPELDKMRHFSELSSHLSFQPGTNYNYSQIGYHLLSLIAEKTSGKSFAKLSSEMFQFCEMEKTFHPDIKKYTQLVKGYSNKGKGVLMENKKGFMNYAAAGGFVSTATDLRRWNNHLFKGHLLKDSNLKRMCSPQPNAIRQHPLFGITQYGYGITISTKDSLLQLGQTGLAPGFCSMNYYFPKSQTSLVILENYIASEEDIKAIFYYHLLILDLFRKIQLENY